VFQNCGLLSGPASRRFDRLRIAGVLVITLGLALQAGAVSAGQTAGQFIVTARLLPAGGGVGGPSSAFCRRSDLPGAFGAVVTVVCSTGAVVAIAPGGTGAPLSPMHGGAYQFATQVWRSGDAVEIADLSTDAGTTTSWRVVTLANREYLEMTLAW
jgi:hypothetical protein